MSIVATIGVQKEVAMNVSLTPELEEMVSRKVKSGLYKSASEVVREALRLMRENDEVKELRKDELRRLIVDGLADLDAGVHEPFDAGTVASIKRTGRERLADPNV